MLVCGDQRGASRHLLGRILPAWPQHGPNCPPCLAGLDAGFEPREVVDLGGLEPPTSTLPVYSPRRRPPPLGPAEARTILSPRAFLAMASPALLRRPAWYRSTCTQNVHTAGGARGLRAYRREHGRRWLQLQSSGCVRWRAETLVSRSALRTISGGPLLWGSPTLLRYLARAVSTRAIRAGHPTRPDEPPGRPMRRLTDCSDERRRGCCSHCGAAPDREQMSSDHVPSKALLNRPLPDNPPVVPICGPCNASFSKDEEYLSVFLAAVSCHRRRLSSTRIAEVVSALGREVDEGVRRRRLPAP